MVCTIDDVIKYKACLSTIDDNISKMNYINSAIQAKEKERDCVNRKHGPIMFLLRALVITLVVFIVLRCIFVLFPSVFPYYFLSPLIGAAAEYYWKKKYMKEEGGAILSGISKEIKKQQENLMTVEEAIYQLYCYSEKLKEIITDKDKDMIGNICALDYIIRHDDREKIVSFLARYNDFTDKYEALDDETYKDLKEQIQKAQTQSIYRNIITKDILQKRQKAGVNIE